MDIVDDIKGAKKAVERERKKQKRKTARQSVNLNLTVYWYISLSTFSVIKCFMII